MGIVSWRKRSTDSSLRKNSYNLPGGSRCLTPLELRKGPGTDVVMESAGVTRVKGDLRGIAKARILSRATMRNIRQNLFIAFIYNLLGVPIAAGVLYPFSGCCLAPSSPSRR